MKIHIVGLLLIAVCIGIIVSMSGDYTQYKTFTVAKMQAGKDFQVVGRLAKDKAMVYDPIKDPNYFSFYVKDKDSTLCKVVFNGTKPQDFERRETIVLTGKMNGESFQCSHILMKCPSKYKNDKLDTKHMEETEFKAKS